MKLAEILQLTAAGFKAKEIKELMEQEDKQPEIVDVKDEPKVEEIKVEEPVVDYKALFEAEQKKNETLESNNKALQGIVNRVDIGQDVVEDLDDVLDNIFKNAIL